MLIPLNILNVSKIRILFFIGVTEPLYIYRYNLIIINNYIIIKSLDNNTKYFAKQRYNTPYACNVI